MWGRKWRERGGLANGGGGEWGEKEEGERGGVGWLMGQGECGGERGGGRGGVLVNRRGGRERGS